MRINWTLAYPQYLEKPCNTMKNDQLLPYLFTVILLTIGPGAPPKNIVIE